MNSLFQKEKIYGWGALLFLPQSVPAPQNHCHLHVGVDNTVGIKLLRWYLFSGGEMTEQVSQSGKPLCTGASLWAVPKLARGLCPLEPRHVNSVSIPAKCPPDIPAEHLCY